VGGGGFFQLLARLSVQLQYGLLRSKNAGGWLVRAELLGHLGWSMWELETSATTCLTIPSLVADAIAVKAYGEPGMYEWLPLTTGLLAIIARAVSLMGNLTIS